MGVNHESLALFSPELRGYKFYMDTPGETDVFDLLFKPDEMFTWDGHERTIRLAPRIGFTLQDIIAVRCEYLNSPEQQTIFRQSAEFADRVFTISRASHSDFEAFYGTTLPMTVIYHGSDLGAMADNVQSSE